MKAVAALVTALLLTACGGDGHPSRAKGTSTTTVPSAAASGAAGSTTTARASGGKTGRTTTTRPGGPTTTATLPTTAKGVPAAPLEVHMASPCVKRNRTQSITVKSTPGFQLAVATQWPDGGGHLDWNAWAVGTIPPNGVFVKSWPIPGAAPTGQARTDVTVTNRDGSQIAFAHPTWRIASSCP